MSWKTVSSAANRAACHVWHTLGAGISSRHILLKVTSGTPTKYEVQAAPQVQLLNDLGISTINYDLVGCGDSQAPRPDTYAQLLQTYSPEANYLDMENILQTMTQARPWLRRCAGWWDLQALEGF